MPGEPGDGAFLRKLAEQLNGSSAEAAAELLAGLLEQMNVEAVGRLMEKLAPTRELDYAPCPIRLLVSSSEIGLRLMSAEKEPFTVEWIERSIRPGDVVYDIGANVGAYSLIAAKTTGNGARIFAFEPSAPSFHDLYRNVLLNGCAGSVVPLPLALWSDNGPLCFTPSSPVAGAARHRTGREGAEEGGALGILGVRLDDLVDRFGLPAPTHAKIDTDGYELQVLRGAERTLSRPSWRSVIVELDREETNRNRKIRKLLASAGFDTGCPHGRRASPGFPHPEGRPDVYWTFTRLPARATRARRPRPPRANPARFAHVRTMHARAVIAALLVVAFLCLTFAVLPGELRDLLYDAFGE
jgi:FkbM family methyltransferase